MFKYKTIRGSNEINGQKVATLEVTEPLETHWKNAREENKKLIISEVNLTKKQIENELRSCSNQADRITLMAARDLYF